MDFVDLSRRCELQNFSFWHSSIKFDYIFNMAHQIEMLSRQTQNVYDWTNKLLNTIPFHLWDITPEILSSNIIWQAGHLVISFYYHSIIVIKGHQMDLLQKIPMKDYATLFDKADPLSSVGKMDPKIIYDHLLIVQQRSIDVIRSLSLEDLQNDLEPSQLVHPVAKTKLEALEWNLNHTMWHCGQIGMIKRIIDTRYDFGRK